MVDATRHRVTSPSSILRGPPMSKFRQTIPIGVARTTKATLPARTKADLARRDSSVFILPTRGANEGGSPQCTVCLGKAAALICSSSQPRSTRKGAGGLIAAPPLRWRRCVPAWRQLLGLLRLPPSACEASAPSPFGELQEALSLPLHPRRITYSPRKALLMALISPSTWRPS